VDRISHFPIDFCTTVQRYCAVCEERVAKKARKKQKKTKRNKKKLQDLIGYIFAQNTYAALPAPKLSCEVESQTLLTMPLFVKIGKGVSAP